MHQPFTEPVTPAQDIVEPGFIESTLDALQNALASAQKRYNKIRNKNISTAQYELMCKLGLESAVRYPEEWQKFYKNNVGERCDYEKLNKLFYKFYKLKIKQQKVASFQSSWYNI